LGIGAPSGMNFILALTVGLLVFLVVDTLLEALEVAGQLPGIFSGVPMVLLVAMLALLGLMASERLFRRGREEASRLGTSYRIALGIGLHNLGEGLAIGAAYAIGSLALGASLVVGFALLALMSAWLLSLVNPRRPWDAAVFAVSPMLALTALINWDLLAVALVFGAVLIGLSLMPVGIKWIAGQNPEAPDYAAMPKIALGAGTLLARASFELGQREDGRPGCRSHGRSS
jgi:hypothetical protein